MRTLFLTLITCLFVLPAHAKYSGGTGEPNDPYQIATAADLIALGEDPSDYDKHFILTADIDLSAYDGKEGRPAFNIIGDSYEAGTAVGAGGVYLSGTPFRGIFDGNGHTISHLTAVKAKNACRGLFGGLAYSGQILNLGVVDVNITSSDGTVGGLVAYNHGTVTHCYSTGTVTGQSDVGGLVGTNNGNISESYSIGTLNGTWGVGGLVGWNRKETVWVGAGFITFRQARVSQCYSSGSVSGRYAVGGLVGNNAGGDVTQCYSTGLVSGTKDIGGLIGQNTVYYDEGIVLHSFWDIETSGQNTSAGGKGLTTAEMQTARTFLLWGTCGNEGIWTINERNDYPRLAWENRPGEAISLSPLSGLLVGTGTESDPFLIYTAEDLYLIGLFQCEWDKHFKLMADVDLSGFDGKNGRPAFNVVGVCYYDYHSVGPSPKREIPQPFTGVFDGSGHNVSHLTLNGGGYLGLFGQLYGEVRNLGVVDVNVTGLGSYVGGIAGYSAGRITNSYSSGSVSGGRYVGGLVGDNAGLVGDCYSTCAVSGTTNVGGLVGWNGRYVTCCYSIGTVTATGKSVGGMLGAGPSVVIASFWDTQTSGQTTSADGTGKTTAQMQTASTFLNAGWDFVGETANGTEDIWWILDGKDYPRLWWQYGRALSLDPPDGARDVSRSAILRWIRGGAEFNHDVYFADDRAAVANATNQTQGIYRGRQTAETATYDPGILEWGKTYYWRIDEINEADPNGPRKGSVWSFTTTECIRFPHPVDAASDVGQQTILSWVPGELGLQYDVFLGKNKNDVTWATPQTPGIYRGRQPSEITTYKPGDLEISTTYYWRVDGVDKAAPQGPWRGSVWSFTTGDFLLVVDDFESYTVDLNAGEAIWQIWVDGYYVDANYPGNGTGSIVGYIETGGDTFGETTIVHNGQQSMPMDYNDVKTPWYSEAERTWETAQDWSIGEAETLTLYFRGKAGNGRDPLYVGIEDSAGRIAVVTHSDADAVLATEWQKWHIALAEVRAAGVDIASVKKMYIGVGDRNNPKPGGTGRIYIDDIRLTKRMP